MSAPLYYLQDPADGLFVLVPFAGNRRFPSVEWRAQRDLATVCTREAWENWANRVGVDLRSSSWIYVRADHDAMEPYHTDLVRLLGVNAASRLNCEPKVTPDR